MEKQVVFLGGGGRSGSRGMGDPQDLEIYSSLEWPSSVMFLKSLASKDASLRTGWSQMGARQSLGIISRFWGS